MPLRSAMNSRCPGAEMIRPRVISPTTAERSVVALLQMRTGCRPARRRSRRRRLSIVGLFKFCNCTPIELKRPGMAP